MMGLLMLGIDRPRRLRRTPLYARRPKMFRRRRCIRTVEEMPTHRGEREIIAPD
jgi:hypothetical protein